MAKSAQEIVLGIPLGPGWDKRWMAELDEELNKLRTEIEQLRGALKPYADTENWYTVRTPKNQYDGDDSMWENDVYCGHADGDSPWTGAHTALKL